MPYVKIFFLPYISASLPNGTRNTAEARRNEVAIQPIITASIENSCPIDGSAIFIEEDINDIRNDVVEAITSVAFLLVPVLVGFDISMKILRLDRQDLQIYFRYGKNIEDKTTKRMISYDVSTVKLQCICEIWLTCLYQRK